jgi:hypothetical protein
VANGSALPVIISTSSKNMRSRRRSVRASPSKVTTMRAGESSRSSSAIEAWLGN